jgi:MFS family permease
VRTSATLGAPGEAVDDEGVQVLIARDGNAQEEVLVTGDDEDAEGLDRVVHTSQGLAAIGYTIIVVSRSAPLSIGGFVLLGAGIALVVPLSYSAAGHLGPHPSHAIAGAATVSYSSTLITPGAAGAIASAASLPVSFLLITMLTVSIRVGARKCDACNPRVAECLVARTTWRC